MRNRKSIGVDADGVIRNFPFSLIRTYKKYYPDHKIVPLRNWKNYELHHYFPIKIGITRFYSEEHPEEIYLGSPRYVGALKFMNELNEDFNVVIVTNQPNKHLEYLTEEWLKLFSIPFYDFFPTPDKTRFKGEFILEDAPHHLEAILSKRAAIPVCFGRPWNRNWQGLRVNRYKSFLELIRNHK